MTVTVLYIGGSGRSGSTLLERLLGQVPGVVTIGELVHLAERSLIGDERCGCGEPFSACPFWTEVGEKAFGSWDAVDGADWAHRQRQVDRNRYLPQLAWPRSPEFRRRLDEHTERLARVYEAVAVVSGATVLVDSSKHASTAFVLRHVPGIDLRVVHLVRDSRAVSHSWTRQVVRPEVHDRPALMPQFRPTKAATLWTTLNLGFHALARLGTPTTFLQYESLLRDPRGHLGRVLEAAGHPVGPGDLDFLGDGWADLAPLHSVSGNPMRFDVGRVTLRLDDEWPERLAPRDRRAVTALTAPLLARYGYLRTRPRAR